MREHQSVIGQSVGHHIILAVDVVHRPMNPALSKGVTEGDAGSKVRPQVGRAASSLPAAKDDNLARDNLGVQFEDDPLINVCHAKRPLHAALETNVFSHVAGMLGVESTVVRSARRARPRHANLPKSSSPRGCGASPTVLWARTIVPVEHSVFGIPRWPEAGCTAFSAGTSGKMAGDPRALESADDGLDKGVGSDVSCVAPRAITDEPHSSKESDPKRFLGAIPIGLKEHIGDGPLCSRHARRRPQPSLRLASDRTVEQVRSGVDVTATKMTRSSKREAVRRDKPCLRAEPVEVEAHQFPPMTLRDGAREGADARDAPLRIPAMRQEATAEICAPRRSLCWNIEVRAVQKHVNIVDLVKSFPTNIFLQNLASIQKRTSPLKFDHLAEKSE